MGVLRGEFWRREQSQREFRRFGDRSATLTVNGGMLEVTTLLLENIKLSEIEFQIFLSHTLLAPPQLYNQYKSVSRF